VRVLALVTDAFGGLGGIAQYNRDFLTALALSPGITAVTALPRFGKQPEHLPNRLVQFSPSPNPFAWSARAAGLALRSRPDLVFCGHLNAAPLAAAIGAAIARPVWLQVHGFEAWSSRTALMRRAVESSSLVTSVSRYTRHRLLSWCGISPDRVRVLPNTLRAEHGPRPKRSDLVARHSLNGRKVILTVGRMAAAEAYKGHDRIIRCLPALRRYIPQVTYLIVGGGDDLARLKALANALQVEEIVCFAGQVLAEELPDYYALATVFAMPSTGEGFGIVFVEAAAAGIPVIGGNRDGSVDALADGAIGVTVDPSDGQALSAALLNALCAVPTSSPYGVQRFAFKNFSSHVDKLIQDLVD